MYASSLEESDLMHSFQLCSVVFLFVELSPIHEVPGQGQSDKLPKLQIIRLQVLSVT